MISLVNITIDELVFFIVYSIYTNLFEHEDDLEQLNHINGHLYSNLILFKFMEYGFFVKNC